MTQLWRIRCSGGHVWIMGAKIRMDSISMEAILAKNIKWRAVMSRSAGLVQEKR
jgi:hypothetical protein